MSFETLEEKLKKISMISTAPKQPNPWTDTCNDERIREQTPDKILIRRIVNDL